MPNINLIYLKLKNFKNIKEGEISFAKNNKPFFNENENLVNNISEEMTNILGLYGQNGSGKTAVIEAFDLLKNVMSGQNLGKEIPYYNYIHVNEDKSDLLFVFLVKENGKEYIFSYNIILEKKSNKSLVNKPATLELSDEKKLNINEISEDFYYAAITYEQIKFKLLEKGEQEVNFIEYASKLEIEPVKLYFKLDEESKKNLSDDKELQKNLTLAKEYNKSYIFGAESGIYWSLFRLNLNFKYPELLFFANIIARFIIFARNELIVINKGRQGSISPKKEEILPLALYASNIGWILDLNLTSAINIPKENLNLLGKFISNQINPVLKNIIPGLSLKIKDLNSDALGKDSKTIFKKIEIIAIKNDIEIPLRYESDGTKKIIGLLSAIIAVTNNPDIFLAVDELDSGVFEYLLGELLSVIKEQIKGRFIFTSHNLIVLERLDVDSIRFSTVDESKKFVSFYGLKDTNNLRNLYLRMIKIGNDDKNKFEFYCETDKYEISSAIRKAGENKIE